jgi:2-polyprenyl-6-methoxyphenol hydroxylase-like FAD-dependent oxidoreductase
MPQGDVPILVVGAGPTGLAMACELARHGAPVRIIDELPGILPFCRATGIHARTLEVFQDLGIVDEFLAVGQPIRAVNEYANGVRFRHTRFGVVDSPYPVTLSVEQHRTEAILEALLGRLGAKVERGTQLMSFRERLDGVRATLRHADGQEEVVETPWLVGCDGAHSTVRHLNRQHFPGEADPRQYVLADVVVEPPVATDEAHSFLGDHGFLFMFPLPEGRMLVGGEIPEHHERTEVPALEEIQSLVRERGPRGARVKQPRWCSYFRIHYRVARHYRHGRIFLAGDAVHVHSLMGGLGMNTGIQDAYNLAWKLALVWRGRAPASLLDAYEKERHAVAEDVIRTSRRMTEDAEAFRDLSEEERDRRYRHAFVPDARQLSQLDRHREVLDLDYRRSSICSEHRGRGSEGEGFAGGPHAGAQALDAGPLEVAGEACTLFELLRGPKHVLLLFARDGRGVASRERVADLCASVVRSYGDVVDLCIVAHGMPDSPPDGPPGARMVLDPAGSLRRRYAASGECLYLIRPDGYVGYRSAPVSLPSFRGYLERVFASRPG